MWGTFRKILMASAACLFLDGAMPAFADDAPPASDTTAANTTVEPPKKTWTGVGEFGLASASGNTRTDNINAKLGINQENDTWKNSFSASMLRARGEVTTTDDSGNEEKHMEYTANRYDLNGAIGYKFDPANYLVSTARYEHDEFGADLWQGTFSLGYGHIFMQNDTINLFTEIGPGYKRYNPAGTGEVDQEAVGRGLLHFDYQMTSSTKFQDVLLVEAGSKTQYYQNDTSLAVSMTKALALKIGYQIRYSNPAPDGTGHTDRLLTTNLIYNF